MRATAFPRSYNYLMLCKYRFTLDVYKAAQHLHMRANRRVRLGFLFWHRLMPVISVAAFALLLWDCFHRHFAFPALLGGVLAGISWIGLYVPLMRPYRIRRGFRRIMESDRGLEQPVELELRDQELISRIPGRSEGRFLPAAIHDVVRDERICLIYIQKKLFLFIPRQSMPDEFWTALAAWSGKARTI